MRPTFAKSITLSALMVVALLGLTPSAVLASTKPSIKLLSSSGPRKIAAVKGCKKYSRKGEVTFRVKVKGLQKLVVVPTKKANKGQGTVEVFRDHIPSAAYKKYPVANFLGAVPATTFTLCLSLPFMQTKGKHTIFLSLAKSTGVLYKGVKPASMTVKLK
ncbi:MAG TPA: hypothetical protein VFB34_11005 [Chloroflexota bacterium]|nr:hypothetical protein [Chloroflexota bacterium]